MAVENIARYNQYPFQWKGLSTDTKPTPGGSNEYPVDSLFFETDTQRRFYWDGEGWFLDKIGGNRLTADFYTEVQKGNVTGHTMVHKFGRNDAVPNGSWAFVTLLGQTSHVLSAATTVRIKAGGDAADTAAGAGAREITVQGLREITLAEETEVIATAGAGVSLATARLFWRVHRVWVSSVGTYGGANTADIDIENGAGGTDIIKIAIEEGQTQDAVFSIEGGKTGYLLSIHITVDSGKKADIRMFTRNSLDDTTAPMPAKRLKLYFDGIAGEFHYDPKGAELSLDEKTDIWFEAQGVGATAEVSVDFEILMVDN